LSKARVVELLTMAVKIVLATKARETKVAMAEAREMKMAMAKAREMAKVKAREMAMVKAREMAMVKAREMAMVKAREMAMVKSKMMESSRRSERQLRHSRLTVAHRTKSTQEDEEKMGLQLPSLLMKPDAGVFIYNTETKGISTFT